MLAQTSANAKTESATPGNGNSGSSGGAPLRYNYTSGGRHTISAWNDANYVYSLPQIIKGISPLANLEIVSMLNTPKLGYYMCYFGKQISIAKYNPKLYLGITVTISERWLENSGETTPNANQWPNSYQSNTQKGEDKKLSVALLFLAQIIL